MRYIEKYLKSGDHILEIGAGTGRYSHALARQGYVVDAIELVEHNIEIFQKNTQADENISIVQGNALDLSVFPNDKYDITQKSLIYKVNLPRATNIRCTGMGGLDEKKDI